MSLFKKMLARVGIGSVKVDFRLPSHQLTAGEEITGTVRIQGGKTEQELQSCEIALFTEYTTYYTDSEGEHRTSTAKVLLNAYTLPCDFHIQSFEVKQYPLSIAIPLHTPITLSREKIWFETRLNMEKAVDSLDKDRITVLPHPLMQRILDAMNRLGFPLVESYLTENGNTQVSPDPFIQRIIYGVSDEYHLLLDEIMATPVWMPDKLHLILGINRKAGLLHTIAEKDIITETIEFLPEEWLARDNDAFARHIKAVIDKATATE